MFDKFGEFDSVEEINKCAEGLKAEGDYKSLTALAVENGIDPMDADDYIENCVDIFATPLMAAYGKLKIENEELKLNDIMEDWLNYIKLRCQESEEMARAIRKTKKSLKGCIGALLAWSYKHQRDVDKDILKAAGVKANRCTMGIPGMGQAKKIITEYYLGK